MRDTWEQQAQAAAKAAATPLWPLSDTDLVDCLHLVHHWESHVSALKARLVHEAADRGVPARHGHRTVPGWLRAHLLLDPQPARELALQANALGTHPLLERAVTEGRIDLRQSLVIAAAVDAIPATLNTLDPDTFDPDTLAPDTPDTASPHTTTPDTAIPDTAGITEAAETTLIEMAAQLPAYQLRRLGDRILFHVAPEIAEQAEQTALHRHEQRAHRSRALTLTRPTAGIVRIVGILDLEAAAIIETALQPLCRPHPDDNRTPPQQRADALTDICRLALRTTELPNHGGEPPQVTVTIPYKPLTRTLATETPDNDTPGTRTPATRTPDNGTPATRTPDNGTLGTGTLDNGERLSPTTARRIACDARILPLLLGGQGQILDAGRTRRTTHGPLRRALTARDAGCTFPGCDRPPRWCDAHHLTPWTQGGATSLDNLILLCRHHHRLLHEPEHGWQARLTTDQQPEFLPPPWIDPTRQPRRNLYHLRL